MGVTSVQLAWLVFAALIAGTVDAIAGGGGLITLPALLAVGLPPHLALGTNKGQSVFGSAAALWRFVRAALVDRQRAPLLFVLGGLGSLGGAALVLWIRPEVLRPLVLCMLIGVAVFMVLRRERPEPHVPKAHLVVPISASIALLIGAYDGFFGPGCGTFLIVAFVGLLGMALPQATANAKVVNFASNLAAIGLFWVRGVVLWKISLPMAVGQALGGVIGAHLAIRGGAKLIRIVVLLVVAALVVKLGRDLLAR